MSRLFFEYSFSLAAPTVSASAVLGTPSTALGARSDMYVDPVTLDYVETDNGDLLETADSRTLMMCMLELELGASPYDPQDGTRLADLRRRGDPITPEIIQGDTQRAGGILATDGVIADLVVEVRDSRGEVLVDEAGRSAVVLRWRDLASGSPIDAVFTAGR